MYSSQISTFILIILYLIISVTHYYQIYFIKTQLYQFISIIILYMLQPSFDIQDFRILQFHKIHHNNIIPLHNTSLQPWQIQKITIYSNQLKQYKQTKQQKLPDVQKFLSTVKNTCISPTQKIRRRQINKKQIQKTRFNQDNLEQKTKINQIFRSKYKQTKLKLLNMPRSVEYKIDDVNQNLNFKKCDDLYKNIYKKSNPIIPLKTKNISDSSVFEPKNTYRNNFQKLLKLKQKIRKKKMCYLQKTNKPYFFNNQYKNQIRFSQNKSSNSRNKDISERYSYFVFEQQKFMEYRPRKESIRNLMNNKFRKGKSLQQRMDQKQEQIQNRIKRKSMKNIQKIRDGKYFSDKNNLSRQKDRYRLNETSGR